MDGSGNPPKCGGPAGGVDRGRSSRCATDDDSSDDCSSYRDDDLESSDDDEEEEVGGGKNKELEWDNSTLAI